MDVDADRSAKTYAYSNDFARCASSGLWAKDFETKWFSFPYLRDFSEFPLFGNFYTPPYQQKQIRGRFWNTHEQINQLPCHCSLPPIRHRFATVGRRIAVLFAGSSPVPRRFVSDSSSILRRFFVDSSPNLHRFFADSSLDLCRLFAASSLILLRIFSGRAGHQVRNGGLPAILWAETGLAAHTTSSCMLELRHVLQNGGRKPSCEERVGNRYMNYPFAEHGFASSPRLAWHTPSFEDLPMKTKTYTTKPKHAKLDTKLGLGAWCL